MNFKKTAIALSVSAFSVSAFSAAFQLNESSGSGLGRSFAGDAVIADDAAVLARNPAAMSLHKRAALSVLTTYIDPGVDVEGVAGPDLITKAPGSQFESSSLDRDGVVPTAFIPSAYYISPVDDKLAFGFGLNSNFGLSSKYGNSYAAGSIGGETELTTINANLSAAYQLSSQFSLGLGLNVVYGDARLVRFVGQTGSAVLSKPDQPVPASAELLSMEGDDVSFGWNIGAMYQLNEQHRFGLSFRSEVELEFEGEISQQGLIDQGQLAIDLPWVAEFSGFHQLGEQWAAHYSVMFTHWSSFERLEAFADQAGDAAVFSKEENFEDTYRFALGVTHYLNEQLSLRVGIAQDESAAVDDFRSISIPDSDRTWFSLGATYNVTDKDSIDFGIAYIKGDTVDVAEGDAVLERVPVTVTGPNRDWQFESEGKALLLSLQYNRSF